VANHLSKTLGPLFRRAVVRIFVDSIVIHRWWICHRLPERSFFVAGRQFHVCARCTGMIAGLGLGLFLIPIRSAILPVAAISVAAVALDGMTQMFGWRTSNNVLRFGTGFAAAAAVIPALLALWNI